jgi:RimJ/RimL family protein N-acetyltransferase
MTIVELTDDDFAALLRGEISVRPGLTQPPGGVDQPEVLRHVRRMASNLQRTGFSGGHWMMVVNGEVVGLCGFKAPPSRNGEIELGYGVAESRRGRGHATAAVSAVIEVTRYSRTVRAIVALTAVGNIASQRVLEHSGFERVDTRVDPDDGEVFYWRRRLSRLSPSYEDCSSPRVSVDP